jgi:pheromone a factor receptor
MHAFLSRRLQFNAILRGSKSGITTGTFLRLCAFATSDLLLTIPFAIYYLQTYIKNLHPWVSWGNVHENFGIIFYYDAALLYQQLDPSVPTYPTTYWIQKWTCVLAAFMFFAFFGLTDDAVKEYVRWIDRIKVILQRIAGISKRPINP